MDTENITAKTIADAITYRRISALIGCVESAISNAVRANKFPATWFGVISNECEEIGIECPRNLFSFKIAAPIDDVQIPRAEAIELPSP